ncbi:sigma-K factor-processing regulatory protein BofA [Kroppenstedtia guangzhouensis]|uniref:Sigma-K factor-processing regulatory protein BofA n=1 Tax=Kroppenstedtia guangzhouensis TaxID=1274356 RepID=A0ABQ1H6A3_9BACL|nr:pro-sigmaK processing inhibitor BofA family protein [Kroppenstedtia guangzhouensis]GGA58782.1 sigma-K factor-processing regulatory protein BofA [Kroppenstedtia guangzhouensis]
MAIEWWLLLAVAGVILFMLISRSMVKPLRWIWYSLLYSAMGALVLFLLNLAAEWMEFRIPINPVTAFITGVLGLPGLVCLVVVKLFLVAG